VCENDDHGRVGAVKPGHYFTLGTYANCGYGYGCGLGWKEWDYDHYQWGGFGSKCYDRVKKIWVELKYAKYTIESKPAYNKRIRQNFQCTHMSVPIEESETECTQVNANRAFDGISLFEAHLCCPKGWKKWGDGSGCIKSSEALEWPDTQEEMYCFLYGNDVEGNIWTGLGLGEETWVEGDGCPHPCPSTVKYTLAKQFYKSN